MNLCLTLYNDIPFSFGIDTSGNYGYIKAGADTVTPFSSTITTDLFCGSNVNSATTPTYSFTNMETKCKKAYVAFIAHGFSISSSATSSDKISGYPSATNCRTTSIYRADFNGCFSCYIYSIDNLNTNASISFYGRSTKTLTYATAFGFIVYVK